MALLDFLFGPKAHLYRTGNWMDADDWNYGRQDDHEGMFGFDIYEENDF